MKGYVLSTDYNFLWKLIHKGYRVPAWVLYTDKFGNDEKIYDLVEVKLRYKSNFYCIGTRGRGLESYSNELDDFLFDCKANELQFIVPNILYQTQTLNQNSI